MKIERSNLVFFTVELGRPFPPCATPFTFKGMEACSAHTDSGHICVEHAVTQDKKAYTTFTSPGRVSPSTLVRDKRV